MSEVIIYHCYSAEPLNPPQIKPGFSLVDKLSSKLVLGAKVLSLAGIFFLIYSFLPSAWYTLQAGGKNLVSSALRQTAEVKTLAETTNKAVVMNKNLDYQPILDSRLSV